MSSYAKRNLINRLNSVSCTAVSTQRSRQFTPGRLGVFGLSAFVSAMLVGCGDSVTGINDITTAESDIYELELDAEVGPLDDGNSASEPFFIIPGDYEIDSDGVAIDVPELGAALPAVPTRQFEGAWSRVFNWPVSPIHMMLLPDNTVLTYGTNPDAQNATAFTFDKWSRWRGKGTASHETTPTGIETNLFCSAQAMLPDGNVLISAGDGNKVDDASLKNQGIDATTLFDYKTNVLSNGPAMFYPRWYPTLVTMPDGKQLVLGGRSYKSDLAAELNEVSIPPTPEIYDPATGQWELLSGATNQSLFNRSWYYPRSWVRQDGNVIMADHGQDRLFELSVNDGGTLTELGQYSGSFGSPNSPAVMFAPGKILFVGSNRRVEILDINQSVPTVTPTGSNSVGRVWADATVLANGEVFLSGGIKTGASDNSGDYPGEIWNPETGEWTLTDMARKARWYHSTAMLLPNAKVLVAGGGPPGPVINMNAELFNPPYLFNADGSRAARPKIDSVGEVNYSANFNATMRNDNALSKVSLVRAGSVTHSFDQGQRYMELDFEQQGETLTVSAPANANLAPPGLYMLFAFSSTGTPSHARFVMLGEGNTMMGFADAGF